MSPRASTKVNVDSASVLNARHAAARPRLRSRRSDSSVPSPVSAAREASWEARPSIRCFDPHHSIVFFDEHSTPVAEMTVCFECGNFRLMPGRADERAMTDAEGIFIADTCRALGVGGCPPAGTFRMPDFPTLPEHASRALLTMVEREDLLRSLALSAAHGVKEDLRLADLTAIDRKVLCAWFAGARHRTSGGFQCEDGRELRLDDYDSCVMPVERTCDATVGDFVACTRGRLGKLCGVDPGECGKTDACHRGVVLWHR